ncbi:hypothetical protein LG201_08835 [Methylobacillus gramineus]|uniref:c-type cytochrome n=1 Tax=Methylobacillus gramineus TaxID=755169 RepID=UPI001CFF86C9|nr:hypothetical protein [Methylobacillus gramineus]MCB5185308.1 hypothetical protein [Methylobacillus gramineus]
MEANTHTRTLASSCLICHGNGTVQHAAIPGLAALDEAYFIKKMQIFRNSADEHAVMVQHAKGLSEEEIQQLAKYFSEQRRACPVAKKKSFREMNQAE